MKLLLHPQVEQQIEKFVEHAPHAILITGKAGSGKRSLAYYAAARVLGVDPDAIERYPHITLVEPVDGSISIDAVRSLQHTLSLKNGSSNAQRVAIVLDGHTLGEEAQNALLKTLEEPPAGAVIIITAAGASNLLPTVRSRMQELAVTTPGSADLQKHFAALGHSTETIQRAGRLSGGLPGLMHALLTGDDSHPLYVATAQARDLLSKDTYQRLLLVDSLAKNKQACLDLCFVLGQMADISLQTPKPLAAQQSWRRVLTASYEASSQLATNAGPKLIMTNLMLSL